jgi:hypothetical protein
MFGMYYFPDEGLMNHSLHTAIIDRRGRLVANIEGNQFTPDQLCDLVQNAQIRPAVAEYALGTWLIRPLAVTRFRAHSQ